MWAMPDFHVCKIKALDFAAIANHILEIFGHAMPVEIWKYAVVLQGICDLSILHVTSFSSLFLTVERTGLVAPSEGCPMCAHSSAPLPPDMSNVICR